jgi:hypothetical protein
MGPPAGRTSDGAAAPNFRDGFLNVEPAPALPMRQRAALGMGDMGLPRLDASKGSAFTQIIRPPAQPGMPAKPDLVPPPPTRPPSALPVIIAVSLLVIGVVVVLLVVALGKH